MACPTPAALAPVDFNACPTTASLPATESALLMPALTVASALMIAVTAVESLESPLPISAALRMRGAILSLSARTLSVVDVPAVCASSAVLTKAEISAASLKSAVIVNSYTA